MQPCSIVLSTTRKSLVKIPESESTKLKGHQYISEQFYKEIIIRRNHATLFKNNTSWYHPEYRQSSINPNTG